MSRRSKRNKNSKRQSTYTPSRPEISPIHPKTENQRLLMEYILDKDVTIANGEAGCGKEQPNDTPVLTPNGYKLMGDIKTGDYVVARNGKPTLVTGVFPQGYKDVYEVEFNDGTITKCGLDHLWAVRTPKLREKGKPFVVKPLKELIEKTKSSRGGDYYEIPLCEPVEFPEKELPIDPYLLGLLLGGEGLDLQGNTGDSKFIPEDYLYGSINQRLGLLRGLMDASGTTSRRGFIFSSENHNLISGVAHLVNSLGGITNTSEKKPGEHTVCIQLPSEIIPFKLPSKAGEVRENCRPVKKIRDIRLVGKHESTCIMVEDEEHLYLTNDFIVTHNTFVTLYQAVQMLEHGWVDKILYIKPNVDFEGERGIGFLQGSVDEKLLPLFQPIMDNMKFCTKGKKMELLQQKKIEIGLLEYLRGRNLDKTFVILDEAQNTSIHAVKTVISRLEINDDSFSKIVITGDIGQCDTRDKLNNGLRYCLNNLHGLDEVGVVNFTRRDNVRNPRLNAILARFP